MHVYLQLVLHWPGGIWRPLNDSEQAEPPTMHSAGNAGGTATVFGCPARETFDVSQSDLQSCRGGKCLAAMPLNRDCTSADGSAGGQQCR